MSHHQHKRLAQWRRLEGVMTQEHRMRLARWHSLETKRVLAAALGETPDPVWSVVANVVAEYKYGPGKKETRRGTKHFTPGAKVYCFPPQWGDGYERIMVIGRHRASHRYITVVIRSSRLTNWRVQLVYSPHVIREMIRAQCYYLPISIQQVQDARRYGSTWDGTPESKDRAAAIVATMREREVLACLQNNWDASEDDVERHSPRDDAG